MGKTNFILILAMGTMVIVSNLNAQNTFSYTQSDKETYSLYIQGNWNELIKQGKKALKNGIDYYYLRVRMGVAYYHLGKYRLAIKHLLKANKTNQLDPFVNEYLVYSYLAVGDLERALYHYKLLPKHVQTRISLFKTGVYRLDFNFQTFANLNYQQQSKEPSQIAELDKNAYGLYVGYNTSLSKKLYLYQMFFIQQVNTTFFDTSQTGETFQLSGTQPSSGSSGSTGSGGSGGSTGGMGQGGMGTRNANLNTDSTLANVQLYQFSVKSYQTRLLSSFRWILGKRTSLVFHNNFGYYGSNFLFSTGATFLFEQTMFTIGIRADYLYFNSSFYSTALIFILYPTKNDKFYLRIEPVFDNQINKSKPLVRTEIGFRLGKAYLSGGFYYGTIPNYIEDNGYFVYATNRLISGQKFLNFLITGKKISFYTTLLLANYSGLHTFSYNGLLIRTGLILNLWNSTKKHKIKGS